MDSSTSPDTKTEEQRPAPRIRVVCVVYNPGPELLTFSDSLRKATTEDIEVRLVNNGDANKYLDQVCQIWNIDAIEPGENLGYGRGVNLGAKGFTGDWIVAANPDLIWEENSLENLVSVAEKTPRAASFGPCIKNTDGSVYPSARNLPSIYNGIGHALFKNIWKKNPWSRKYWNLDALDPKHASPISAQWLSGACLLLRAKAFFEVSGFNEKYFMFVEDLELGERLGKNGWLNIYVPSAVVIHDQGTSWRSKPEKMIIAHHESTETYLREKYSKWYQRPLRMVLRVGLKLHLKLELKLNNSPLSKRR